MRSTDARGGRRPSFLRSQAERVRARLAAARGDAEQAESAFASAAESMKELGVPFWVAVTELEHAEWLASQLRATDAEPLLADAEELFERLQTLGWLGRVDASSVRRRAPMSSGATGPAAST